MNRILVAGATGTVGTQVVGELLARGAPVRALVRNPEAAAARLAAAGRSARSSATPPAHPGNVDTRHGEAQAPLGDVEARRGDVELFAGDLDDPASVGLAMRGVDRVYLSAADGPRKVVHETAVIDAAAVAGVRRIVKLSALHADPASPLLPFRWHGEIEHHLRRSGVPAVVLRPAFFMTNLLMVAGGVAATGLLPAPTAGRRVAMIDVRDVAAVAAVTLLADGHEGRTYPLTGPAAVTFTEVAAALTAATGRTVRSLDLTEEQAQPRFAAAGLPDWLTAHLAGVFGLIRAGGFEQATDNVHAITGRRPHTIADFSRDHAAAFAPAPIRAG